ncbi:DUF590-domain-containing protein [Linderina pennispora]|uniref:DUF590-domain-containing protein n=1 Tax=Linderina pennispora TaxID=61395 RepID=A0A1Y1W2Y7_9FUNG|nr:DUF590-domain-containing protein [Linderina pennispora]ORX67848.1 DUF590-domain-containing protein [Linderina pennispora]
MNSTGSSDARERPPLKFLQYWAMQRMNTASDSSATTDVSVEQQQQQQLPGFADFVISFKYTAPSGDSVLKKARNRSEGQRAAEEKRAAKADKVSDALSELVQRLTRAGLDVEIREALAAKRVQTVGDSRIRTPAAVYPVPARDAAARVADRSRQPTPSRLTQRRRTTPRSCYRLGTAQAECMSPSERQRIVYKLIVGPVEDGCADVNPERERWVECVFPLQDRSFNKEWIKHWSSKWLIDRHDLRSIRHHFGEEIAMYFAFLQSYFLWLAIPSAVGVLAWLFGWSFSWQFGIVIVLWSVIFTETWARRESDIATYWGVHGAEKGCLDASPAVPPRPIPYFSVGKRWLRRMLSVPVTIALALVMGAFVSIIFAVQTFLGEYYNGPFQTLLGLTPVVLFSLCLPLYTALCTHIAKLLTEYENYEYETEYTAQYTTKVFIFQFLQDHLYLFLTAWVFVPYQDTFEHLLRSVYLLITELPPWLTPFLAREIEKHSGRLAMVAIKSSSTPAVAKIQDLLTSFIVTGQIVNLMTETGLPLIMRWWSTRALKKADKEPSSTNSSTNSSTTAVADLSEKPHSSILGNTLTRASTGGFDAWADASQFIANVTSEVELPEYDTYGDYAEMASQFGRVTFFSIAWPLAPLAAFLNNWLELRTDAAKICATTKRPISRRVDTIGPWLTMLRFMCWLSSITNALLIYQFHPNCSFLPTVSNPEVMKRFGRTNLSLALVVLLFSEHMFLAIQWVITQVMASWPSAYERIVTRAHAGSKRRWLDKAPATLRDLVDMDVDLGAERWR